MKRPTLKDATFTLACYVAILFLYLQAACFGNAEAQTLYLSPSEIAPLGTQNVQNFTFPTPAIQLENYNSIQVNVAAPAGYAWQVNIVNPDGLQNNPPELGFELEYANSLSNPWATVNSANLDFNFVQGGKANLSAPTSFVLLPTDANGFECDVGDYVNGDFAFTGFTMTIGFDNSSLTDGALEGFNFSELSLNYGSDFVGSSLTLVPVPEPTTLTLGILGLLLLLVCKLKRLKQYGVLGIKSILCL